MRGPARRHERATAGLAPGRWTWLVVASVDALIKG